MWIVLWDPFLMKKFLKSKICGSHEQCMRPTGVLKSQILPLLFTLFYYSYALVLVHQVLVFKKKKKKKAQTWTHKTWKHWIQTASISIITYQFNQLWFFFFVFLKIMCLQHCYLESWIRNNAKNTILFTIVKCSMWGSKTTLG